MTKLINLTPCQLCHIMGENVNLRLTDTIKDNTTYQLCNECYVKYVADMYEAIGYVNTRWHEALWRAKEDKTVISEVLKYIADHPDHVKETDKDTWVIQKPDGVYHLKSAGLDLWKIINNK